MLTFGSVNLLHLNNILWIKYHKQILGKIQMWNLAWKIFVLELTCSFERNIDSANARKKERYTQLKSDIEDQGYTCYLVPFEIGSRGYISKRNKLDLTTVFHATKLKFNTAKCMKDLSKIALLSSFSIFHAYTQPSWQDPPLLKP